MFQMWISFYHFIKTNKFLTEKKTKQNIFYSTIQKFVGSYLFIYFWKKTILLSKSAFIWQKQ